MKHSEHARSRQFLELTLAIRHHEWNYLKDTIRLWYFIFACGVALLAWWL